MSREKLPNRRECGRFEFEHSGLRYTATTSCFEDGRIAEVFLSAGKAGSAVEAVARDGAIAVSLALQSGCELESLRKAMTRLDDGEAAGLLGRALDLIAGKGGEA